MRTFVVPVHAMPDLLEGTPFLLFGQCTNMSECEKQGVVLASGIVDAVAWLDITAAFGKPA